jgi:hypothetical protein
MLRGRPDAASPITVSDGSILAIAAVSAPDVMVRSIGNALGALTISPSPSAMLFETFRVWQDNDASVRSAAELLLPSQHRAPSIAPNRETNRSIPLAQKDVAELYLAFELPRRVMYYLAPHSSSVQPESPTRTTPPVSVPVANPASMLEYIDVSGLGFHYLAVEYQQVRKYIPPAASTPTEIKTAVEASGGDTSTNTTKTDHTSAPIATGMSKRPRSNASSWRPNRFRTPR